MTITTSTHSDRLAAAAAITAKARQSITEADDLAADVADLKLRAAGGDLDDQGAAVLVAKSEKARINDITAPRRQRALDDALAAEVKVGLEVLAALSDALAPLEADAAQAADKLTEALVDPAAAALDHDIVLARELGVARCWVEKAAPGVYGASVLRERIKTASTTTWGALHVPVEAALIVATFDAEVAGIKSGTAMLKSILKAAQKARD
jgi:hypothetical protein